jgi:hypothetical protein
MRNRPPYSVEQEEGTPLGGGLLNQQRSVGKTKLCDDDIARSAVRNSLFMLLFLPTPAKECPLRPDQSSRESWARELANSARRRSRLQRLTVRSLYACPVPAKPQNSGKAEV